MLPAKEKVRVIIDTNVWVSVLIGRSLQGVFQLIINGRIQNVTSIQLLTEIRLVTQREKFRKFFSQKNVDELILILERISEKVEPESIASICRDPKDDFILAIAKKSKADFIISGDSDLLVLQQYENTIILNANSFMEWMAENWS
jgi:putative PIN family toxin of toxin-antitoxin system